MYDFNERWIRYFVHIFWIWCFEVVFIICCLTHWLLLLVQYFFFSFGIFNAFFDHSKLCNRKIDWRWMCHKVKCSYSFLFSCFIRKNKIIIKCMSICFWMVRGWKRSAGLQLECFVLILFIEIWKHDQIVVTKRRKKKYEAMCYCCLFIKFKHVKSI